MSGGDMYQRIVVGTDGSVRASAAVDHAAALASATGATLHLVQGSGSAITVAPLYGDVATFDPRTIVAACEAELQPLADRLRQQGIDVSVHVQPVAGADALVAVAAKVNADIIVCGNRGLSGIGRVLGSVPKSVLNHAPCAVLVVDTS